MYNKMNKHMKWRNVIVKEQFYDKLLNINTCGNKSEMNNSIHYHPYEPTPYCALEELFKYYHVKASDHIVDFGCGKGRLNFYLNYTFHASVIGIEMNKNFYKEAIKNQDSYLKKTKKNKENIQFHCCLAEQYEIQPFDNKFYFFNPFSVQVFMKVINNILLSVEKTNREIELILYYASDDYIYFLDNHSSFELIEEVILPDLFERNTYERFLIYRLA